MAKSGFWLRGAKGKLAGTVLYHGKGGTYQREIVTPTNPRTDGQIAQRIKFASTVKFYKSAIANFFRFAYEDKKATESDYNAFMRNNIGKGMMMTREYHGNVNCPAIGQFLLAKGSLVKPVVTDGMGSDTIRYAVASTEAPTTAQALATALANQYGLAIGDIITLVYVYSSIESITGDPVNVPDWRVAQIIVGDETDTRSIDDLSADMGGVLTVTTSNVVITTAAPRACGASLIFSRKTADGLKVCDAPLLLNQSALSIFNESYTEEYTRAALDSWGARGQAVLEGSLVQ